MNGERPVASYEGAGGTSPTISLCPARKGGPCAPENYYDLHCSPPKLHLGSVPTHTSVLATGLKGETHIKRSIKCFSVT